MRLVDSTGYVGIIGTGDYVELCRKKLRVALRYAFPAPS